MQTGEDQPDEEAEVVSNQIKTKPPIFLRKQTTNLRPYTASSKNKNI